MPEEKKEVKGTITEFTEVSFDDLGTVDSTENTSEEDASEEETDKE